MIVQQEISTLRLVPLQGCFTRKSLVCCRILSHNLYQPAEELYGGNLGRASSLSGEDGEFLRLDPNAHYSFLVPNKWKEAQEREPLPRSSRES